jgi:hypothetical protein
MPRKIKKGNDIWEQSEMLSPMIETRLRAIIMMVTYDLKNRITSQIAPPRGDRDLR